MSAYVQLNKARTANGRSWQREDLVHVPSCVARSMDRKGDGRKLKNGSPEVLQIKAAKRKADEVKAEARAKAKAKAEAKAAKAEAKAKASAQG